ncbi:hypothetical protein [Rathayibacter rathayi]|uniref:hypothetical protein n=1 Tax=Rathayibacter rathayi TaxID=33887 RepID=UPI0015E33F7B|nr:hypothetical protein [Rathayibacter rathayi]
MNERPLTSRARQLLRWVRIIAAVLLLWDTVGAVCIFATLSLCCHGRSCMAPG